MCHPRALSRGFCRPSARPRPSVRSPQAYVVKLRDVAERGSAEPTSTPVIRSAMNNFEHGSDDWNSLNNVIETFGEYGEDNGIIVQAERLDDGNPASFTRSERGGTISIDLSQMENSASKARISTGVYVASMYAHEGGHAFNRHLDDNGATTVYALEESAYRTQTAVYLGIGSNWNGARGWGPEYAGHTRRAFIGAGASLSRDRRCGNGSCYAPW